MLLFFCLRKLLNKSCNLYVPAKLKSALLCNKKWVSSEDSVKGTIEKCGFTTVRICTILFNNAEEAGVFQMSLNHCSYGLLLKVYKMAYKQCSRWKGTNAVKSTFSAFLWNILYTEFYACFYKDAHSNSWRDF